MSLRILVHIGYHKTGTSWLQQSLFTIPPFRQPWSSMTIADELILPHDLEFDAEVARSSLVQGIADGGDQGETLVLSWERLSGSAHAGGFDSATLCRRLHASFPEAKVLIGVREQRAALLALYRQYVRDGGIARLDGYLHPRNPAEIPQFRFEHLEYDRLVALYLTTFGRDRVLVQPFEDLRADPGDVAARVCRFVDLEAPRAGALQTGTVNPALGAVTTAVKRHANKVFVRNSLSPGARYYVKDHERRFERLDAMLPRVASHPLDRRWRATVDGAVGERYRASNSRLARLIGRDLRTLGYDLAE